MDPPAYFFSWKKESRLQTERYNINIPGKGCGFRVTARSVLFYKNCRQFQADFFTHLIFPYCIQTVYSLYTVSWADKILSLFKYFKRTGEPLTEEMYTAGHYMLALLQNIVERQISETFDFFFTFVPRILTLLEFFIHQLKHKWIVLKTILKFTLKLTLKNCDMFRCSHTIIREGIIRACYSYSC
jgi:hypothetical protein